MTLVVAISEQCVLERPAEAARWRPLRRWHEGQTIAIPPSADSANEGILILGGRDEKGDAASKVGLRCFLSIASDAP
jgi:hypothetical protein